jgi:hypothetical protein
LRWLELRVSSYIRNAMLRSEESNIFSKLLDSIGKNPEVRMVTITCLEEEDNQALEPCDERIESLLSQLPLVISRIQYKELAIRSGTEQEGREEVTTGSDIFSQGTWTVNARKHMQTREESGPSLQSRILQK